MAVLVAIRTHEGTFETTIGNLHQDIIWFDISVLRVKPCLSTGGICLPVNEPKFMNSFNSQDALGHVESGNVLRKCVVLDEHSHEVTTRKEFHNQVEEGRILERVE